MISRRNFAQTAAIASGALALPAAGLALPLAGAASATPAPLATPAAAPQATAATARPPRLGPLHRVRTDVLDVAYHVAGPADGTPVVLLHGWPYSPAGSYAEVAPRLARDGYRCYVPYLRGHGPTRFLAADTPRSGQQAAIGADLIGLLDALDVDRALLAGYDWGGRAANVVAALWPERCLGLVSVNNYLIQQLATADEPLAPALESGYWYFFYFLTERGRKGLAADPKEFARVIWRRASPQWRFTEAELDEAAEQWTNPDYVDVVLHSYRHRLAAAPGAAAYEELERRLAAQPPITVPAVTLDGREDGVTPWTDGSASRAHFTGPRRHHVVDRAGHTLPQERPDAFAAAVREAATLGR
ncbi:alpha/beta hydrolase [Streptomyces sp. HSW2009]|uniref:alpha/beta fold hydrolase n=1 Tax=Streptomyces sp. HSW2009 TaxID=3142890 RepID=UPI0032EC74B1